MQYAGYTRLKKAAIAETAYVRLFQAYEENDFWPLTS
jgi:hypothetical protein